MAYYYQNPDAPKPNRPPSLGVVALIERDGGLLLESRVDDARWGIVGGVVETDESLGVALCREVAEETGLTVRAYRLFGTFSDPSRIIRYRDGNTMRIVTLAYWVDVEPFESLHHSTESLDLRFFAHAALVELDVVETHRHIVDRYLAARPEQPVVLE